MVKGLGFRVSREYGNIVYRPGFRGLHSLIPY